MFRPVDATRELFNPIGHELCDVPRGEFRSRRTSLFGDPWARHVHQWTLLMKLAGEWWRNRTKSTAKGNIVNFVRTLRSNSIDCVKFLIRSGSAWTLQSKACYSERSWRAVSSSSACIGWDDKTSWRLWDEWEHEATGTSHDVYVCVCMNMNLYYERDVVLCDFLWYGWILYILNDF